MALVGPAVGLALAVGFGLAAVALSVAGSPAVAVAVVAWLAVGNALALFSLLPAPLDGGRVLRGCMAPRSGNRARASVVATAGQWVGAGLIGYGLLGTLTGWGFGSLWTALVGWFLVGAARQGGHAALGSGLGGHRADQVMTRAPAADRPGSGLHAARNRRARAGGRPAPARAFDGSRPGWSARPRYFLLPAARRIWSGPASPSHRRPWSGRPRPAGGRPGRSPGRRHPVAAVVAGGQLLGLITMDDLARATASGGRAQAVA